MGRYLVAPPDVSQDRANTLRAAFQKMLVDKRFLGDVERLQIEFDPLPASDLQALVARTTGRSPETIEVTRKLLGP